MAADAAGPARPRTFWVLQTGEPLHVDPGNPRPMRAMNAADALVAAGHRVVVWSSAFSHQHRHHRTRRPETRVVSERLEYRLIPSPGYRVNVGLGRLWDHAWLAHNLRRALESAEPPDACLVGYPPMEIALVMIRWLARHRRPSLLDVKDQWPESFLELVPGHLRPLARAAVAPYFTLARRAMGEATGILTMSESYLSWALGLAGRPRRPADLVVPLTRPAREPSDAEVRAASAWWDARGVAADGRPRFCFVGSHTRSFDLGPVLSAARQLAGTHPEAEVVICGSGERSGEWREAAKGLANVRFPGWVDEAQIRVLAERSLAFLAPYRRLPGFEANVPNKIVDAFALGLPVVTSLGGEVGSLIRTHGVGLRYGSGERPLHECLRALIEDPELRARMASAARALYASAFDYRQAYGALTAHLEMLGAGAGPCDGWSGERSDGRRPHRA
ncbi:MAG TPA: glycosyltransferase [Longimicrobiales bacterium]|nr:glycosyltransferase [Longimicrobiales bacterium]